MCVLLKLTAVSRFQTMCCMYYVFMLLLCSRLSHSTERCLRSCCSGSSCMSYQIFYAGYCILHWHAVNFMLCWEGVLTHHIRCSRLFHYTTTRILALLILPETSSILLSILETTVQPGPFQQHTKSLPTHLVFTVFRVRHAVMAFQKIN